MEVLTDAQKIALRNENYLDGYKTAGSVSDGFGSLEILNTKKADETTVDVSVEKKWVGTALGSVDVRLIQTTDTIENEELAKIKESQYPINNGLDSIVLEENKEYLWDLSGIIPDSGDEVLVTVVPENFVTAVMDSSNPKKLKITSGENEGSGTVRNCAKINQSYKGEMV